jgi:hypothetical protein
MGLERGGSIRRQLQGGLAKLVAKALQQVLGDQQNVRAALAQGGDADGRWSRRRS